MKLDGADWLVTEIGGKRFGFPAEFVLTVIKIPPVTSIPLTPVFLLGIVNHNGEILPMVDSVSILDQKKSKSPETAVVLNYHGISCGITIESVIGLRPVFSTSPPPAGHDPRRDRFSKGAVIIDGAPTLLMDLESLFSFLQSALEAPLPLRVEK